jgi:hypothetical protein
MSLGNDENYSQLLNRNILKAHRLFANKPDILAHKEISLNDPDLCQLGNCFSVLLTVVIITQLLPLRIEA